MSTVKVTEGRSECARSNEKGVRTMHRKRRLLIITGIGIAISILIGSNDAFSREKYETIDASAYGTGTQMGALIGVTLNIYEFSTPADKSILIQAYEKGQNQGLYNALSKMKAVRHSTPWPPLHELTRGIPKIGSPGWRCPRAGVELGIIELPL